MVFEGHLSTRYFIRQLGGVDVSFLGLSQNWLEKVCIYFFVSQFNMFFDKYIFSFMNLTACYMDYSYVITHHLFKTGKKNSLKYII